MYILDLSNHVIRVLIHWAHAKDDYLGNNPVSVGDQGLKLTKKQAAHYVIREFCSYRKTDRYLSLGYATTKNKNLDTFELPIGSIESDPFYMVKIINYKSWNRIPLFRYDTTNHTASFSRLFLNKFW